MITVAGNLFTAPRPGDAIGHGCNVRGAMGAGVALEFRKRFPDDYLHYRGACVSTQGDGLLGTALLTGRNPYARFCMFTQVDPIPISHTEHETKASRLSAIERATEDALSQCLALGIPRLFIPTVGCGLAGLIWGDVQPVLQGVSDKNPQVELVVVDFQTSRDPV